MEKRGYGSSRIPFFLGPAGVFFYLRGLIERKIVAFPRVSSSKTGLSVSSSCVSLSKSRRFLTGLRLISRMISSLLIPARSAELPGSTSVTTTPL